MQAILIDDEKHCGGALQILLKKYCPEVEIIEICYNGADGIKAIQKLNPDLIFLDIAMPKMNGFEMLSRISNPNFEVIFTTAYDNYAIQAFKVSAIDYLLKPIDRKELVLAVAKAKQKFQRKQKEADPLFYKKQLDLFLENVRHPQHIFPNIALPTLSGLEMVRTDEIMYVESDGNYSKITKENKEALFISKPLKEMEEMLKAYHFIRIHHSYVVNPNYISRYVKGDGGYVILKNGEHLNVSRRKKEDLLKSLKSN